MRKFFFLMAVCAVIYKGLPALVESSAVASEIKAHNEQIELAAAAVRR